MHDVELVLLILLVAVAGLGTLSRLLGIPYPIVLVVGGLVLGFLPGVPDVGSTRTSSSSSSCRRCSTRRRSSRACATSRPTCGRSRCWPSAS